MFNIKQQDVSKRLDLFDSQSTHKWQEDVYTNIYSEYID